MGTEGAPARVSEWPDPRLREVLELVPGDARRALLRVLTSSPRARAEVIGKCFGRHDAQDMGELLIDIDEDEFVRAAVVETLRAMDSPEPPIPCPPDRSWI